MKSTRSSIAAILVVFIGVAAFVAVLPAAEPPGESDKPAPQAGPKPDKDGWVNVSM